MNNSKENTTTGGGIKQQLRNLPQAILDLPRFLGTRKDNPKAPANSKWQHPENQRLYSKLRGVRGFVAATEQEGGLLFLDFDHATNLDGTFVNAEAERWYKLLRGEKFFCERSQSNTGLHMFAEPTAGKFGKVVGKIYFDADKKSFLEVFYGTTKFCLPTGSLFHCEPQAPIATGEAADVMLQTLIDELEKQNRKHEQKPNKSTQSGDNAANRQNTIPNTQAEKPSEQERAIAMIAHIPCAEQTYEDWIYTGMILKSNGNELADWEQWSRADERFKEGECERKWLGFSDSGGLTIATLHKLAAYYGYSEKDFQREWYQLHPELSTRRPVSMGNEQTHDNAPRTRDKIKDCPVDLEIPANFIFGKGGITLVEPPRKANGTPKYICAARTPIVPTKKFREPTTGTVEYEIAILSDGEWCTTEIEGRVLADPRAICKLCDKGALIDEPKLICRFLNAIIATNADLQRVKTYRQTGWTSDDFDDFAYPTADGSTVIRRPGYNYERIFKPRGDADKWIQKFKEVTEQGGAVARVVIGGTCAASLVRPLELPNLQIHVHGRKSIGKTPLLKFAVSIFGDSNVGALANTFAATPKSRLETAAAFRDLPLICEELESISQREAEKLPQDIYNFSLGVYPSALNKDGTKREEKQFSGTRLTTGEHSLVQQNGNAGEFKRVLELRCSDLLDEDFAADLHGFCNRNRGLFGAQWIRYILAHRDSIGKQYHQTLKAVKAAQKDSNKNDTTQLQTLIIAAVTYQHFKICLGLQSEVDNEEVTNDIAAIVATLPTATEMDDTQRFIEELKSFVAGHTAYFVREGDNNVSDFYNNEDTDGDITQRALDRFGKIFKNGEVAILYPHAFRLIAEDKLKFKSADKLASELNDKGCLRTSDKRNTFSSWINGKTERTIRFKAGIICTAETAQQQDFDIEIA